MAASSSGASGSPGSRSTPAGEATDLKALLRAFQALRALDPFMQTVTAQVLVEIALREAQGDPPTLTDTAEAVGIPQATMSRLRRVLEAGDDKMGPTGGVGLIRSYQDPLNYRAMRINLSPRGRAFIHQLRSALSWPQ